MTSRAPLPRRRLAVAGAFFTQGLTFVALTAKLPQLQDSVDLSPSAFSILMLALVLCAGLGSVVGEFLAARGGSALTLRVGFVAVMTALPLIGFAHGIGLLVVAMAAYGFGLGLVDAGCNMQAVAIEHRYARPLMPTFHAAWTCGGIVGTLVALATHHWSVLAAAAILMILPAAGVLLPYLPHARPEPTTTPARVERALPWRRILTLGLALVVFYMVDTAVTTWAPTYLHRTFDAGDALVAVATLPYLVFSLLGRASGDRLTARFGAPALVALAGVIGCLGLAVAVFAPGATLALVGMAVAGLGLAVVAPLAYSVAARLARESLGGEGSAGGSNGRPDGNDAPLQAASDAVIARFNQFNYVGALLGAVLTGALGDSSLRYGFAVPMVLVLALVVLARSFV